MAERERTRVCYKCSRKLLLEETHDSIVYFVAMADSPYVKIGVTRNLKNRLGHFRTGSPHEYKLLKTALGSPEHEKALHHKFGHLLHKNEWFNLTPELADFIAAIPDGAKLQLDALI